jgi:hypothetical protein
MIKRELINCNSSSGKVTSNTLLFHEKGSNNIAILFPGGDNLTDVPTLHYARKAALLSGCDVLCLEYGYKIGGANSKPEIITAVVSECHNIILQCVKRGYETVFFISKSIGHVVSLKVDELLNREIKHICYTPLESNIDDILRRKCVVFTGTKDKYLSFDGRKKLSTSDNVELLAFENAVHSLEIDDNYDESIRILKYVTDKCSEFIIKNSVKV